MAAPDLTPAGQSWRWPRGPRLTPSRRDRAPKDPYGPEHRKIRKALMDYLAASGPWACPICGRAMTAEMGRGLHLHHSSPEAKLAGLPGDQLAHARCNIREGARLGAAVANGTAAETPRPWPRSRDW